MALTQIDDRGLKTPIDLLDNEKIRFGTGNDLELYHDGTASYIQDAGTGQLRIDSNAFEVMNAADSEYIIKTAENGGVELYYDNSKKLETTSGGITLLGHALPASSNTYDLGSSAKPWRDIYIQNDLYVEDDGKIIVGDGDDLQVYHDGTNTQIRNLTGSLLSMSDTYDFRSYSSNETMIKGVLNGAVELYYDGTKKLETTTTGVKVTNATTPLVEVQNSTDTSYSGVKLQQSSGSGGYFAINKLGTNSSATGGANAAQIWQSANAPMVFGTNDGEKARFSADGRFYLNTDTPIDGDCKVSIFGPFGSSGCGVEIKHQGNSGANRDFIRFYNTSASEAGSIEHTSSTGVAFQTSSDHRLKENIADITDGIERLKLLKPRKFSWIEDPELGLRDGFIAHEVSPAIPHCVSGEKDAVKEDGSIQIQTIEYSQLTPLLTAALQEAIAKIETLETEVAALKAK